MPPLQLCSLQLFGITRSTKYSKVVIGWQRQEERFLGFDALQSARFDNMRTLSITLPRQMKLTMGKTGDGERDPVLQCRELNVEECLPCF